MILSERGLMEKEKYIKTLNERKLSFIDDIPSKLIAREHYGFIDEKGYKYWLSYDNIRDKRTKKFRIVSKQNKYSIENIQLFIRKNGGNAIVLSSKYNNEREHLKLKCGRCGKVYTACWSHIYMEHKFQCNRCGRDRGYDEELKIDTEKKCKKHGYTIIEGTYKSRGQFDMIDKQGYKYCNCNVCNLSTRTNKTRRFDSRNIYQLENMRLYLKTNNIPTKILNDKNIRPKQDYVRAICIECGSEYNVFWGKLIGGKRNAPSLRCRRCTKRQSNLEYMVEQYLIQNNVNYEIEKRFSWCRDKRELPFDFYLPDFNTVIEVHGHQHYYENNNFTMSLSEQQKRDEHKKQRCIENGVGYVAIPFWLIVQSTQETYKKIIDNIIG